MYRDILIDILATIGLISVIGFGVIFIILGRFEDDDY